MSMALKKFTHDPAKGDASRILPESAGRFWPGSIRIVKIRTIHDRCDAYRPASASFATFPAPGPARSSSLPNPENEARNLTGARPPAKPENQCAMSRSPKSLSRRHLLKGFGTSVAGFAVWPNGRRAYAGYGPNDALNFAGVGVGGKGNSDIDHASNFTAGSRRSAISTSSVWARRPKKFTDAAKYVDFRKLSRKWATRSTPSSWPARTTPTPASITAMNMGKHVYCQKPLTHSVWEARMMRQIAAQKGVCTQMGNQGTADPGLRRGAEVVQSGGIGDVQEVYVWTNRPFKYWKQSPDIVARPTEMPPVPAHVHWDLFVGPAPMRPYHPVYHPHD